MKRKNFVASKQKKAQSEIVGLMIIVIIITVGMLFYLSFVATKSQKESNEDVRKEYIDGELSTTFVQTLVKTSIEDCGSLTFSDLIIYCGLDETPRTCSANTCWLLQNTLDTVLNETLNKWDRSYYLEINFGLPSEKLNLTNSTYGCAPTSLGINSPGYQPIPYRHTYEKAYVSLFICKK